MEYGLPLPFFYLITYSFSPDQSEFTALNCYTGAVPACIYAAPPPLVENSKGSPYSITERRVPELIPVLAGDVSHKPGGGLPLLSARPAVIPQPLRGLLPILLLGEPGQNGCEQFA